MENILFQRAASGQKIKVFLDATDPLEYIYISTEPRGNYDYTRGYTYIYGELDSYKAIQQFCQRGEGPASGKSAHSGYHIHLILSSMIQTHAHFLAIYAACLKCRALRMSCSRPFKYSAK